MAQGIDIEMVNAPVDHDNSSTLKSGFDIQNHKSFKMNMETHQHREANQVMTGGEWDLVIRRELSWD